MKGKTPARFRCVFAVSLCSASSAPPGERKQVELEVEQQPNPKTRVVPLGRERKIVMKNISKFGLVLVAVVASIAASSRQKAPLRNDQSGLAPLTMAQVSDVNGNPATSENTPLYFSRRCQPGDPLV